MRKQILILAIMSLLFTTMFVSAVDIGVGVEQEINNSATNNSLRLVILNPSSTFRLNQSESIYQEYYVKVQNKNPFPVDVEIFEPENADKYKFSFLNIVNFTLEPEGYAQVNYRFAPVESGDYYFSIPVTFKSAESQFSLSQTINVHAEPKDKYPWLNYILLILGIMLVMTIIIWFIRKRVLKGGKEDETITNTSDYYSTGTDDFADGDSSTSSTG